jgi:DNA-binding FrmR family transcriptional regulator
MVSEDAYCVDILTQISAVVSGVEKVALRLLREHMKGCVADALRSSGSSDEARDEKIDELVKVVERFLQT